MMRWEIMFFPMYGIVFGVSYWNTYMDAFDGEQIDVEENMIQIFLGFFGISIIWRNYV